MAKAYVRGSKTAAIIELARRPGGVSGGEITEATGWVAGSAKWRVEHIAESYSLYASRLVRADNTIAYRMTAKAPAAPKAKAKAKPAAVKAPVAAKATPAKKTVANNDGKVVPLKRAA